MLDLAIAINTDVSGSTIVETNHGAKLRAPAWPQDCDFQLVGFSPSGEHCEVVWTEELAEDIGRALMTLESVAAFKGRRPDWYRRLERYSKGTSPPIS
jgi:hypothetical protein